MNTNEISDGKNSEQQKNLLVTVNLVELIEALLTDIEFAGEQVSHPADYREIPQSLADAIYAKCRNKCLAYVQFPDGKELNITGKPITSPLLWRHSKFVASTEKWLHNKQVAEQERQQMFIRQHNISYAIRTIMKFTGVDEKFALPLAVKWVEEGKERNLVMMGGKGFVKKFEDLP